MIKRIKRVATAFWAYEPYERLKLLLLAICFFFIVGSYSVLHSLKPSVFAATVGLEYQPYTQWCTIVLVVPIMFVLSYLINRFKQYQLVFYVISFYALLGFFFAYLLADPQMGLDNGTPHINRWLGWAFYVYVDFYTLFILSMFWGFSNSINSPQSAKKNYGFIVAFSKISGGSAALWASYYLKGDAVLTTCRVPTVIFCAAAGLLIAAVSAWLINKKVPAQYLHGYEAAYQADSSPSAPPEKIGFWEGIRLFRLPYVLGIFGMVCCYEIINSVLDYQMHLLMWENSGKAVSGMSSSMLSYTATFQAVGFLLALFGTTSLLHYLDVKFCLLVMPVLVATMIGWLIYSPSLESIFWLMVILRALHYSFDTPVREILYIPTVKNIRYKSQAWIDSFGRTFSKTSASAFNLLSKRFAEIPLIAGSVFTFVLAAAWLFVAYFMAKKYTETVKNNEAIG